MRATSPRRRPDEPGGGATCGGIGFLSCFSQDVSADPASCPTNPSGWASHGIPGRSQESNRPHLEGVASAGPAEQGTLPSGSASVSGSESTSAGCWLQSRGPSAYPDSECRPRFRPRPREFIAHDREAPSRSQLAGTAEPFRVARPKAMASGWSNSGPGNTESTRVPFRLLAFRLSIAET